MNRPISVGDLVQVILPAECGCTTALGITRVVTAFVLRRGRCPGCGYRKDARLTAILDGPAPFSHWAIDLRRLRRIPPPDELEIEGEKEALHA